MAVKRQSNYELLRILAMLMVVTLHYLNRADALLALGVPVSAVSAAGTVIEAFCIVAVNVYVLISGYFLVDAPFRVGKAVGLIGRILFYTLSVPLIFVLPGLAPMSGEEPLPYHVLQYLFPIETEHYWFATSYLVMYLFSPFLGAAARQLSRRQFQAALGGLLILFSGLKSISPVRFNFDRFGYDFGWFLCVFLVAAYVRLYGIPFLERGKKAAAVYVGSVALILAVTGAVYAVNSRTGSLTYYFTVPFHYNYILCLTGAVGLFYLFRRVHIPEGGLSRLICRIAPLTFGVYLLHEHVDLRNVWFGWTEEIIGRVPGENVFLFLVHLMISVLVVYTAGLFVDWVRSVLFAYVGRLVERRDRSGGFGEN